MKKYLMLAAILAVGTTTMAEEKIASQKLNETVISTENFETSVLDTAKNITIVTQEEIQAKGANTVAEALRGVPGLTVSYMDGADSVFDLRGSGATAKSNTLLLLDGVPMNAPDGIYNTSQISVSQIEKIEVIPAGGAVMYGDGTTGGVINIITKSPENRKNYGSINGEVGSWDTRRGNVNYGTRIGDKFLFDMSYSYSESDGYRDPHPDYKKGDKNEAIFLRGKYLLEDGSLEGKYSYNNNRDSYTSYLTKDKFDKDPGQSGDNGGRTDRKSDEYLLKYTKKLNDKFEFSILSEYSEIKYKYYDTYGDRKTNVKQYFIKPQIKYNYKEDSYLIVGGDWRNSNLKKYSSYGNNDIDKESYAGYILNKTTVGDWQFTQGYRRENVEYEEKLDKNSAVNKDFDNDIFELGANYLYSDTGSIYLNFVQTFRTPNTDELGYWDGNFDQQETRTYELGIKDMYKNTYASVSVFLIDTKDEIYLEKTEKDFFGTNKNFDGEVRRMGTQASLQHYFDKLTLRENITYIQPKVTSGKYDGKEFAGVSRWNINLGATYNFTEKLIGNIDMYYLSSAYAQDDFANKLGKENTYTTVDTNLTYKFNGGLEIYGGVRNLFDKEYANAITSSPAGYKVYYPADGRSYYAGFRYNF